MTTTNSAFAPSYTVILSFLSRDGERRARKVHKGLTWERAMELKESMLNVDTCVGAVMQPCRK